MKTIFIAFVFVICIANVYANTDPFKPYLHDAQVPEHPKFDLAGKYATNLFPGSAVYTYFFEVPPGTNGLQPSLSVFYNSQAVIQAPDILGAGWVLTGNAITRDINDTETITDDFFTLVLNGQSYDLVYDSSIQQYHTFTEQYFRIQNISDYWFVTSPDGTEYRFGYTNDSELTSNTGKNYSLQWSLDLVSDTHNNTISYNYENNPFPGDRGAQYISSIVYNNDEKRRIDFIYESSDRPDWRRIFQESNEVNITRRLVAINVSADDSLVHIYHFDYLLIDNSTNMSSLANISAYGTDGETLLYKASFDYYGFSNVYSQNNNLSWLPVAAFSDGSSVDLGGRLADLNNDGFVDYVVGRSASSDKRVWLNNKTSSWGTNVSSFEFPWYFTNNEDRDFGLRFIELNNDGFIDLIYSTEADYTARKSWLNNGTGWEVASAWMPNFYILNSSLSDISVNIIDLNGDGYDDIIRADTLGDNTHYKFVLLNNHNGWENSSDFLPPMVFTRVDRRDPGVRFIDFNGDGLVDILQSAIDGSAIYRGAWLNNGTGWENVTNGPWAPPTYFVTSAGASLNTDEGVRFVDVNGDGLVDITMGFINSSTVFYGKTWLNTGHGWVSREDLDPPTPFIDYGNNLGRRIADVNGDGISDYIVYYLNDNARSTWVKNETNPYLLANITYEFGGLTKINYNKSTIFNHTGNDSFSDLGFNVYVVSSIEQNNSLASGFNIYSITNYSYKNGLYDFGKKQFRGFGIVNETLPDENTLVHYFYQDDARKGLEYQKDTYNGSNVLFQSELNNYRIVANGSFYQVYLDNSSIRHYDGLLNFKSINYSYAYDGYGNVIGKNYSDGTKREEWIFIVNTTNWILNKPRKYNLLDGNNDLQIEYYSYDGVQNQAPQDKGELTRVDKWSSTDGVQTTIYDYDFYGNLISITDALGRITEYDYGINDYTYTFKERETNALGHVTNYEYDLGTGNLLWQEKNNIKTYYYYDNFSRIWKEVEAYDSYYSPTKEYVYTFDGIAPEKVQVLEKISENETRETLYFYDGFGNFVQMKQEADGNLSIVKDFFYDDKSRIKAESIPYYLSKDSEFSLTSTYTTNYSYDALDRVIQIRNPDGTRKIIKYVQYNVTTLDERNNKIVYLLDAYDRIINIYEYNSFPELNNTWNNFYSNTTYSYDVADHLIRIIDNQSNVYSFSYDSLGRRVGMSDPDLGNWTYTYDSVGNLIQQIDSRGMKTNLTYDDLNRIVKKENNDSEIYFSYDGQYLGTLSNISDDGQVYSYNYDQKYRIIGEDKFIDGQSFTNDKHYDSADEIIAEKLGVNTFGYDYAIQGSLKGVSRFINSTSYTAFGGVSNRTFSNAKVMSYSYNSSVLRLTQISTSSSLQSMSYSYDNEGNIRRINDTINKRSEEMTYDYLDRLVNVTVGPNQSATYRYVYDELGNILMIVKDSNMTTRFIYDGTQAHAPSAVIENTAGAMVYKPVMSSSSGRNQTFQFYLVNLKNITLTGVNWTVDFGDGSTQEGSGVNLSVGQYQKIQVSHVYSSGSDYKINVTVNANGTIDSTSTTDLSFGVKPSSLSLLSQSETNTTFTLKIRNILSTSVNNVSWNCSGQYGKINMSAYQEASLNLSLIQSNPGYKSLSCMVNSTDGNNIISVDYKVRGIEVDDISTNSIDGSKKQVTFVLKNYFNTSQVNWSIMSDGMQQYGNVTVEGSSTYQFTKQVNYTNPGIKTLVVNTSGFGFYENRTETFVLEGLDIEDYLMVNRTEQDRIYGYQVKNHWSDLNINWTMKDPSVVNNIALNISYNNSIFVFIEENYTASDDYNPEFLVYNGSINATISDRLTIKLLEIISNNALYQYVKNTTVEFVVRNNVQRQNISWTLNTGERNITSTKNIDLNNSQQVFVFVNYNYTTSDGYIATAFVNSTLYNDTLSAGVVV